MSRPTAQDYALVDAHLDPTRSLAAHTAWDVRGCGAKAVMALRASLAAAEDKNATLIRDLELACRDLAAVKLSRDAAEAKLADAEEHADELAAEMEGLLPRYRAHAARRAGKAAVEREEGKR